MIARIDMLALGWIGISSLYAVALFGWDKSRAGKAGKSRVPEFRLLLPCALGGWLGGLLGMLLFRHKTAKTTFKLKFAVAAVVWIGLLWAYWKGRGLMASWIG